MSRENRVPKLTNFHDFSNFVVSIIYILKIKLNFVDLPKLIYI